MPLYICNCVRGVICDAAKARIAADITRAHCDMTGTSRAFVHVFFFEDAPRTPINGLSVFVFGTLQISDPVPHVIDLVTRVTASVSAHADVPQNEISVDVMDMCAIWVMQGGEVLPAPSGRQV